MHKTQVQWTVAKAKLNEALAQYKGTPTALSRASGVDFYAARRFLNEGVGSRGKNAFRLCAFFEIEFSENAHAQEPEIVDLHKLLDEVWDGSRPHAALLAKLIESTRSYTVEERRGQG
ncbi:hypothetical protein [Burkholderia sp. KJ006]|uniref:hypothetical protein n=1 Tax=Burkholderia sp. KJ006 TaxID=416344 RepID=UPI0011D1D6B7|nr:hypothetical protein [Burkholderia sp. KJ006]